MVDEVQDFAPLEVRVLLETLRHEAGITLAGDTQQHLIEHSGFTSWTSFFRDLGLEFDYVIVLDVDATNYPDTPVARRVLHVAATRAVHQLWMMSVGTPSPLVQDVDAR